MSIESLSPAQQAAVSYVSSPTIVTAGAGSGKTRTLTSKVAYLVNKLNYAPERILAITFTNKAAAEMKSRLEKATGRRISNFPWVRTFHSACFKILKEHCDLLGYEKPLLIHDDSQQKAHLKKVLAELNLDRKFLYAASSMISNAKNCGDPLRYISANGKIPRKSEVYRRYNEMLEQNNSVDFDDILILTRDLLRKFPQVQKTYQETFDYVLIDEYQDTNETQNQIVDLLLRDGNLTVVGDDYQSIYKFRGADPFHFINFPQKYSNAKLFRLEENYRSTTQIVAASDALIANNMQRIEKKCFSTRQGEPIIIKELSAEDLEAKYVARKAWEYASYKKIPLEKIAILFRTKFTSLPFEKALRSERLPYTIVGAQAFFQRREVQDIHSYLICAVNPKDDLSFERIINVPRRGIGPGAIKKILAGRDRDSSLQDACWKAVRAQLLPKKANAELEKLLILLAQLRDEKPDSAIRAVMRDTLYEDHLQAFAETEEDFATRMENIKEMIYDSSQHATIADYLEEAALVRDDQQDAEKGKGIRLSTIHAAKGLEFSVVFVVALEEGILPHQRSLNLESEKENDEGLEEERRLMYVAMTRASDYLHLTSSMFRRGEMMVTSRFLDEIPEYCLSR
jgi:DNA helicase II / ATP-dependent DNA helicase PcrA